MQFVPRIGAVDPQWEARILREQIRELEEEGDPSGELPHLYGDLRQIDRKEWVLRHPWYDVRKTWRGKSEISGSSTTGRKDECSLGIMVGWFAGIAVLGVIGYFVSKK